MADEPREVAQAQIVDTITRIAERNALGNVLSELQELNAQLIEDVARLTRERDEAIEALKPFARLKNYTDPMRRVHIFQGDEFCATLNRATIVHAYSIVSEQGEG